MNPHSIPAGLQLRSLVKPDGQLEISLATIPTPEPAHDEVVVRIEATPINPSDLGLLFGPADLATLKRSGTDANPVITARIPERAMKAMTSRVGQRCRSATRARASSLPQAIQSADCWARPWP
jgi:NADPH:quinone reductase